MPGSTPGSTPGSETLQVETEEWRRLVRAARAGATDGVAGILADHLDAPVRALLVTTAGGRGVRSRLTLVGGRAVTVTQRIESVEGGTRVEPGVRITVSDGDELWRSLAATLPDSEPPSTQADDADHLLGPEESNLRVRVDAWRGSDRPVMVWDRLWSVVDDRLMDVRTDGDELRLLERPAGSAAEELRSALTEALDAASRAGV
ncbi:hypothetical protein [Myceligenerans pegani]|uniref:Uncharacterized protein n=1 Tax=Myceligenerans pegani TaxID=2776917 RepID=A0ABR9MS76_9MICO|nr:hypothetical protein [Myceligenerans sp. TRM 65318]MBE1874233.1 hypothetical protein [Myceligenerans sp. TRM 65318]MBE3016504.1 hypothetical protein [Myceligenerans sp. TRM 65318]